MKRFFSCCLIGLLLTLPLHAQVSKEALKKWEGSKYSMFIHWGIYSQLGGVWEGNNISRGLSEQIQAHAGIYSDVYARTAKYFNPEKWNADSIVLLAKAAGMRSIVITTKHHDGFCMFGTKTTNFNVVDATPYKRDVLKELSEACARHGCSLGLYFSLIDWHYPQAAPISSHNSDLITKEHFEFNKKQITELLSNYGKITELWFDMGSHSLEQSKEMYKLVHSLQKDCMIGSRLGNDMNDFVVMSDNQEPDYIIGVPWQSPASFFPETWGYRSWQERGDVRYKTKEKLSSLLRVASRGGNYLLNIGPRGDGSVVEFEKEVLLKIGNWLNKNGEAVYGTQADPFHLAFDWGTITTKNNILYLHIMKLPSNKTISLPIKSGKVVDSRVLSTKEKCKYQYNNGGVEVEVPLSVNPEQEFEVIALSFDQDYQVAPINTLNYKKGLILSQNNAFKYYSNSGIDYNSRFRSTIKEAWTLVSNNNRTISPKLYYSEQEKGRDIQLQVGETSLEVQLVDGKPIKLTQDLKNLIWGDIYLLGPLRGGLDGVHDRTEKIDVNTEWGKKQWKKTNWKNDVEYGLEGDLTTVYYSLQEIKSTINQKVILNITSGDGVMVILNGKVISLKNNPLKQERIQDILVLDLKKGTNQLLIKLFNNFQKSINYKLGLANNQQIYFKELSSIRLNKNEYLPISWSLSKPQTPHETLNFSNLFLEL